MDQQRQLEEWLKERLEAHVLTYPHHNIELPVYREAREAKEMFGGDSRGAKPADHMIPPRIQETVFMEPSSLVSELGAVLVELDSLLKRAIQFRDTLQSFYNKEVGGDSGRIVQEYLASGD